MASIKIGIPLIDIRGSVGNTTFSKNKSGHYVQIKAKKPDIRSQARKQGATSYTMLCNEWNALTNEEHGAWDDLQSNKYYPKSYWDHAKRRRCWYKYYKSKDLLGWHIFQMCNHSLFKMTRHLIRHPEDIPPLVDPPPPWAPEPY